MKLQLERRGQPDKTGAFGGKQVQALLSPPVDEDYWTYRVRLTDKQAVLGFPKFGTIGIGFAVEDTNSNTNLPYDCTTDEIAAHIMTNKGDESITTEEVLQAVRLIQDAAPKGKGVEWQGF